MEEKQFNSSNTLEISYTPTILNGVSMFCPYVPKEGSLKINFTNLSQMGEDTVAVFNIILYNQQTNRENNFITTMTVNGSSENVVAKFFDKTRNLEMNANEVHYIKQEIKIARNSTGYLVLSSVEEYPYISIKENGKNVEIINVLPLTNNVATYKTTHNDYNYYINPTYNIVTDEDYSDGRRKLEITQPQWEDDYDEFDRFVINLYKDGNLEEDTSGNEIDQNDDFVNHYTQTNSYENGKIFSNLDSTGDYTVKIHPHIPLQIENESEASRISFLFKNELRVKTVEIETFTNTHRDDVKAQIPKLNNKNVKPNQIQNVDEQLAAISQTHSYDRITPNIDTQFSLTFNTNYYESNIKHIKVFGDVEEN